MNRLRTNSSPFLITGIVMTVVVAAGLLIMSLFEPTTILRIGNGVFDANVAQTQASRAKGLGGVEHLDSHEALILVFPHDDTWKIWMKDMKVPIDIVWLDSEKTVVHSVSNVSPDNQEVFSPTSDARYVVELPAGTVEGQNIKTGRVGTFDIKQEKEKKK